MRKRTEIEVDQQAIDTCINELKKHQKQLNKETAFEDTLSGEIEKLEEDTKDEIMHEVKVLSSITGKDYKVEFCSNFVNPECKIIREEVTQPDKLFKPFKPLKSWSQKHAVSELIAFCRKEGSWIKSSQLEEWLHEKITTTIHRQRNL